MNEHLLVLHSTIAVLRTIQYKCHIKCRIKIQFTIAIKTLDKMLFGRLVIIQRKRNEEFFLKIFSSREVVS